MLHRTHGRSSNSSCSHLFTSLSLPLNLICTTGRRPQEHSLRRNRDWRGGHCPAVGSNAHSSFVQPAMGSLVEDSNGHSRGIDLVLLAPPLPRGFAVYHRRYKDVHRQRGLQLRARWARHVNDYSCQASADNVSECLPSRGAQIGLPGHIARDYTEQHVGPEIIEATPWINLGCQVLRTRPFQDDSTTLSRTSPAAPCL